MNDKIEFMSGHTYIYDQFNDCTIIDISINRQKFLEILAKNIVFAFYIHKYEMAKVFVRLVIQKHLFATYIYNTNVDRNLIQFTIIDPKTITNEKLYFLNDLYCNVWQSGKTCLFGFNTISSETLVCPSKTFDLYIICCESLIMSLLEKTKCSIYVRRVIEYKEKNRFYYILFTIDLKFDHYVLNEILPNFMTKQCMQITEFGNIPSLNDLKWLQRKCCSIIYHTNFRWIYNAVSEVEKKQDESYKNELFKCATQNLINYKYILSTGNFSMNINELSDAESYVHISIETKRNFYRDINNESKSKKFNYSQIDGLTDGPLVAATSVRMCEKITNPLVFNKNWNVNVLNLSMLLNLPEYKGAQNSSVQLTY